MSKWHHSFDINKQQSEHNTVLFAWLSFLDVFHWSCLDERESALPNNTAPGGHTCPTCYDQIFPSQNLISPVADVLRNRLKKTSWGRDEFGAILVTRKKKSFNIHIRTTKLKLKVLIFFALETKCNIFGHSKIKPIASVQLKSQFSRWQYLG